MSLDLRCITRMLSEGELAELAVWEAEMRAYRPPSSQLYKTEPLCNADLLERWAAEDIQWPPSKRTAFPLLIN